MHQKAIMMLNGLIRSVLAAVLTRMNFVLTIIGIVLQVLGYQILLPVYLSDSSINIHRHHRK